MENLLFPMAIITGIFFAFRFDYQGQSWGWGLLYGLFLSPIAAVHMLFVCVRWLSGNVGFGLIERDAASYMDTGLKHMFNEDYDKAIRDFDKVIELDPQSPHAHEIRGRIYTLMSRYDNAIADFNKEISIVESYIENLADDKFGLNPYYFRGLVWTELSENERAIADFSKAIEFDPTSDGYVARAHAYIGLKQYGKAVQDYEEAISLNPNANLYLDKGRAYLELGDHDRALNDFSIALKLDPMQPNNHIETAAAHFSKGDFKRAISELDTGISMIPDFMAMHETLLEELKKEEQMEIYDEVVRDLAGLYAARGVCHLNIREYRKAIENFDDAIKMDAENGSYFRSRGGTYSQLTEHSLAIEDLDFAVRLCPDDSNAYFTRGIARFNMEDFNGAIKDFDDAIELDPNFVDSYTGRGRCYLHLGQSVKALADLDKAISLEDEKVVMPDIMNTVVIILERYYAYAIRGLVYSTMGDARSAERDFDKAIALGYDRSKVEEELSELDALDSTSKEPKREVPAIERELRKGTERGVSSKSLIVERKKTMTSLSRNARYLEFYQSLRNVLKNEYHLPRVRKAQAKNWYSFGPHGPAFLYGVSFSRDDEVLVNLWIDTKDKSKNETLFDALYEQKDSIESDLGVRLVWRRKDNNLSTEVQHLRPGSIDDDDETLEEIQEWMVEWLLKFKKVFEPRLAELVD